jgi:hypothetical protein
MVPHPIASAELGTGTPPVVAAAIVTLLDWIAAAAIRDWPTSRQRTLTVVAREASCTLTGIVPRADAKTRGTVLARAARALLRVQSIDLR